MRGHQSTSFLTACCLVYNEWAWTCQRTTSPVLVHSLSKLRHNLVRNWKVGMKVNHAVTLVHTWHVCHAESALPLLALTRLEGYIQASIVSHSYGGSFCSWHALAGTASYIGVAWQCKSWSVVCSTKHSVAVSALPLEGFMSMLICPANSKDQEPDDGYWLGLKWSPSRRGTHSLHAFCHSQKHKSVYTEVCLWESMFNIRLIWATAGVWSQRNTGRRGCAGRARRRRC